MSSPKYYLQVSPQAQQDIINILRYTGETWGQEQLKSYSSKLDTALILIAQNPEIGYRNLNLSEVHRLYHVGSHVVVYRIEDTIISVVRILHQRMDLTKNI
jgi:toxin ParE1/3/4